jgi:hypothetical protein
MNPRNAGWNTKVNHTATAGVMFRASRELQDTGLISHETADGIGAQVPAFREFCNRVMLVMSDAFTRKIIAVCTTWTFLHRSLLLDE